MVTHDAQRYLRESKAAFNTATTRAADGRPGDYWSAWATAFLGRIRSLEAWLKINPARAAALLAYLLLAAPAAAQPTPAPPAPVVVLPEAPPAPVPPSPKPAPGAPMQLTGDALYVARSEKDCLLLLSTTEAGKRAGDIVKVTLEHGPLRVRGVFVGGSGKSETKHFPEKNIWLIEAAGTGAVEVIVVPSGVVAEAGVFRQMLEVNGARPPPPDPPPGPVDDPLTATLQAALDKETPADKKLLPKLAALYRQSVATANDPATKTAGDLLTTMHGAAQTLIGASLPNVRQALSVELKSLLPTVASTPLDATIRATAAAEFTRIAGILSSLKYPH